MISPSKTNAYLKEVLASSFPDSAYLQGIFANDSKVLNQIYKRYLPSVMKFVLENRGTENDAHDVFQDGLVIIYKKLKKEELELTSGFHTYLFAVCRFVWLRELKKKRRTETSLEEEIRPFIAEVDIEGAYSENEKQKLFNTKLEDLSEESRQVLKMFFNKTSIKDIAKRMGYTEAYAKRKKYKAKEELVAAIRKDPRFRQLAF